MAKTRKGKCREPQSQSWPFERGQAMRWGFALLVAIVSISALGWSVERLYDPRVLPIRQVQIEGDFRHLDRATLAQAVEKVARGGFFSVDVKQVKAVAEQVPWVDRVEVRRVWPAKLKIHVTEQVPLARWGEEGLVNERGVLFRPDLRSFPRQPLPQLGGPDYLAREATQRYLDMSRRLAEVGLKIRELQVNGRRAWRMTLNNDLVVKLGSRHMAERLARFIRLYPRLADPQEGELQQVDLRYTNGFAVRRGAPPEPESKLGGPEARPETEPYQKRVG
ncbi:MAG TPA: cell division protein FtsQ/DivIB [Kiloniellaceae bacterium]|nr:cell division protein FtsQ/DivIB [Kiloniellaceae bacterium]